VRPLSFLRGAAASCRLSHFSTAFLLFLIDRRVHHCGAWRCTYPVKSVEGFESSRTDSTDRNATFYCWLTALLFLTRTLNFVVFFSFFFLPFSTAYFLYESCQTRAIDGNHLSIYCRYFQKVKVNFLSVTRHRVKESIKITEGNRL
jgi:hypothetical protein